MSKSFSWQALSSSDDLAEQVKARQEYIEKHSSPDANYKDLFSYSFDIQQVARKNCENIIGSVEVPVGVAGPLPVKFNDWQAELNIPLATTEGALVASVNRGCKALRQSGITQVMVEQRGMTRTPVFECPSGIEAKRFLDWFEAHIPKIKEIAEKTSSHLHWLGYYAWIRGRHVYIRFAFDTEEAMGMNMVTIALQAALEEALTRHPEIKLVSLTSNVCTDKKDSVINSLLGRGYWVQAESVLPNKVVESVLKTSVDKLKKVHIQKNLVGSNIAGSFSQNAHVANVLAGIYLATGQDLAHVVEGSKAFLSLESEGKDLYAALTLPNINVGVVGGGTTIAQQKQAQLMMGSGQPLSAKQLAAAVGAASLAGELSLLAALAEQKLACSHAKLGRAAKA